MAYVEMTTGEVYVTDNPEFWTEGKAEGKVLGKAEGKRARQRYACRELRKLLGPGTTVYTVLRHVARSGMSRNIDCFAMRRRRGHSCVPRCISMLVSDAIDYPTASDGSVKVGGSGMDMGYAIVYALGSALWPDGTRKPHGTRNGEPDSTGGYALHHEWI